MYELKKNGKVFTIKFVGTGPSFYKKRIYRTAVSRRLRNTDLHHRCHHLGIIGSDVQVGRNNPLCQMSILWDCGCGLWHPVVRSRLEVFIFLSICCLHLQCTFYLETADSRFRNFFVIKPTRCTNFTNLFCRETLHVSNSSSVHHQEFIHCTLSNGVCHTGL